MVAIHTYHAILSIIGGLLKGGASLSNVMNQKIKNNLVHYDATDIASFIYNRQITSEEITLTLIDHIQEVNKELNAVVEERFSKALEEAREADKHIHTASLQDQPLYGVPISIKESLHVKGMKTTGGLSHRKDIYMSHDADVVKRLKEAGAIILCKTNTPSLCFSHETNNKLYGRTNNAWDMHKTSGGSSGGEGALIGVGGAPVGIGSDIGGSIRFPSHFNGVVGFKPGKFQVSTNGHFPPDTIPLKARMSSVGPIGKSVRDVQLVYHITACQTEKKAMYEKMTIEILPNDNGFPLGEETAHTMDKVAEYLQELYQTSYSIPPYFDQSAIIWQELMSIDGGNEIKQLAFNTDRPNVWKEYMKEITTNKTTTHEYLSWALIGAKLFKPSSKRVKEIETFMEDGDRALDIYLKNRMLLFPVYHRTAHKHGELYKEIFSMKKTYKRYMPYIAYANVWGLPSLTIPVGFDTNGLPIGVQIISKSGNESSLFRLGTLLEDKFGGYIRSTIYD